MSGPAADARGYSIATLVVRAAAPGLGEVLGRLDELPGVEVHHIERESGRAVLTLETEQPADEAARLDEIRRTQGVISAELVYHYVEGADA